MVFRESLFHQGLSATTDVNNVPEPLLEIHTGPLSPSEASRQDPLTA